MPPINPTANQLAARVNPTPAVISTPSTGLFRGVGDYGTTLYNSQGQSFNLLDASNGLYDPTTVGAGAQSAQALANLKSQYGIDFNALPAVNIGDYIQSQNHPGAQFFQGANPAGFNFQNATDINSFLGTKAPATISQSSINNTGPNTVVPPGTPQQGPAAVALPNDGGAAPAGTPAAPNYQLQPGETPSQYNARIAAMNPNLPAPGTTSSTGITNTAISSGSLAPTTPLPFTNPTQTNPTDTTGLYTPTDTSGAYTETPEQQQESSLTNILEGLNTQDAGRAGAQTTAEANAGIPAMQQTIQDLTSQRQLLAAKAAQINAAQQPGQGVTSAIDARQRTAALRQNSIDDGLLAATLNATQGNLATAQALANKVVSDVYDPIEAQIKANTANLALIQNDPSTTLADKQQADEQSAIVAAQTQALADQKANLAAVLNFANTAAGNYATSPADFTPTAQYPTATVALAAMQQAHTVADAAMIAAATGLGGGAKTGTWSAPYTIASGDTVQKNSLTGEIKVIDSPASPGSQTTQTDQAISSISSELVPGYKSSSGVPTISPDGTMTLAAWQQLTQNPPAGLTRAIILKNWGSLLVAPDGTVSPNYGLTPVEVRQVTGALGTTGA